MYNYYLLNYQLQICQQRNYCCLIISILVMQIISVRSVQGNISKVYYISPSSNDVLCSTHNQHACFNLSEVATVVIRDRSVLNISLFLAPGNHTLVSNLTVTGYAHFLMKSEDSEQLAIINCGASSQLQIYFSTYVHIHGIILNGCVQNKVKGVERLTIEDCVLSAVGISGRALDISNSTMIIVGSTLNYFTISTETHQSRGGAVLSMQSDILISNSVFSMNKAGKGGVMYCLGSTILINNSTFTKNSAMQGGVLYIEQNGNTVNKNNHIFQDYFLQWKYNISNSSSVSCTTSNFTLNKATRGGVICYYGAEKSSCKLYFDRCKFVFNKASYGAVFLAKYLNAMVINNSSFQNNNANVIGGVGYYHNITLWINSCTFSHNRAGQAGVFYFNHNTHATITSGNFHNNVAAKIGGALNLHDKSDVILAGMITFENNSAQHNAAINVYDSQMTCIRSLVRFTNNSGSITLIHSTGYFAGHTLFENNEGSVHFYDSKVVISGHLTSVRQRSYHQTREGGCITLFLSTVIITGRVTLNDSIATNGGGMLSISSRIIVDVRGEFMVINNMAKDTGGGIYFYYSLLSSRGLILVQGNKANTFGGGIHSISSAIVLIHNRYSQYLKLANNEALSGGGICLEASSKFYVKRLSGATKEVVQYVENSASYGGAIYVVDNTTSGTCASSTGQTVTASLQTECFIQILNPITKKTSYPQIEKYFLFEQNFANISGANLYGGLLDRCTIFSSGRNVRVQYYTLAKSILNNTSSEPVRVCSCVPKNNSIATVLSCTHIPSAVHVVKGRNLTLQIAAVDHVKHKVQAIVYGSLESRKGHLGEGQQTQEIGAACTYLNFSIISPVEDHDHLVLYADGPCKDLGISALKTRVNFDPCLCPTGFEPEPDIKDRCVCSCHHALKRVLPDIECNSKTLLVTRKHDYWLSTVKKGPEPLQYFLTYKQCPSDYCHPSTTSVYINLNDSHGPDAQCAFNRIGVLCGGCQPNLTLSLGSSHCIECPHLWPLLTVAILVGAFLAGLALVALILVLNLTVATGALNGMIFYANIITINQQIFMPFEQPNFHSMFIAWLNLDTGFDVCFFKGLNAYAKAWLQLTFPVYIIFIVVIVIISSHYSKKFANIVSRKNPVATLATLILLSYAKLLHNIIEILSYATLHYTAEDESASFSQVVWLHDGSIAYLKGIHIPLFLVAVFVVIVGFIYTLLLLSWQWLVKFSNRVPFLWVKNTKLSSFIDAYHAPYTARNRYWTGLLLLARVILYLTAAINVSGEPSVILLAISLVIGCILLLHVYSGISIYKKWSLNVLEFTTYFNILAFTAVKFYIQIVGGNHAAIAYASISIQFVVFTLSLLHHIMLECHILDRAKQTRWYKTRFSRNLTTPLLDNEVQCTAPNQKVTYSEVTIKNPDIQLTSEVDSEREGLSLLLSTENSQM